MLDEFDDRYISTLGAKITKKELMFEIPDNGGELRIDMTIWDIMGEKGFRELLKEAYFHGAQGVLAVCDVTRKNTLPELESWIAAIETVTGKIPIRFLANKADLKDAADVTTEEGHQLADLLSMKYFETSAKTGMNVGEVFIHAATSCRTRVKSNVAEQSSV